MEECGDTPGDITTNFLRQPQRGDSFQRDTGWEREGESCQRRSAGNNSNHGDFPGNAMVKNPYSRSHTQ